uniref:Uncharacterized protein n=1 Tax=Haptolina brevifila TaxID=156173 RepID=A0A7S2DBH0_9EUKA
MEPIKTYGPGRRALQARDSRRARRDARSEQNHANPWKPVAAFTWNEKKWNFVCFASVGLSEDMLFGMRKSTPSLDCVTQPMAAPPGSSAMSARQVAAATF